MSSDPQPQPEPGIAELLATMQLESSVRDGAAMLFKLFSSFTDAGFTRPEAMQIVLHQMTMHQQGTSAP